MNFVKFFHPIYIFIIFSVFAIKIQAEPQGESLLEKANRLEKQAGSPLLVSSMVLLDRRDDIPPDVFYTYWRDVHGVLVAQSPLEEINRHYWQYHLAPSDPNLWPNLDGISVKVPTNEHVEGIAMATFDYSADTIAVALSKKKVKSISAQIIQDEANIFKGTYAFMALGENTVELLDKRGSKMYQGEGDSDKYRIIVLLRKKISCDQECFQSYVRQKISNNLINEGHAIYIKLNFWEDQKLTSEDSPDVANLLPTEKSYHAALELEYSSYEQARSAFNKSPMKNSLSSQGNFLSAVAVYPIRSAYSLAYKGKTTLMGLRGYPIAKIINIVGAEIHKQPELLKNIYGSAIELPELK